MRQMKPLGKDSLVRSILRAFGMETRAQCSAPPLPSQVETSLNASVRYPNYTNPMREAEQAKATAIMELQRRQFT